MILVSGIRTKIRRKYKIDASWPIMMNGCSTGWPPIHVRMRRSATKTQKRHWLIGRNIMLRCLDVWSMGMIARIKMDRTRANTPPSLLGIERKIAYANKKYHSGLMCGGVFRGFAGV